MSTQNDDEAQRRLLKEDLAKSFTHERPEPDTEPPTFRPTKQDTSENTQNTTNEGE